MMRDLRWNMALAAVGLSILTLVCCLYVWNRHGYELALHIMAVGFPNPYLPFCDFSPILNAADCLDRGIAIYPVNPCDYWQRGLSYPIMIDLWRHILPAARYYPAIGIAMAAVTIGAASFMYRVRNWREAGILLVLLVSPTMWFVLERANLDEVIFVLFLLAAFFYSRRLVPGTMMAVMAGAIMKFYPVIGAVVLLAETPRRAILWSSLVTCLFAGFLFAGRHELAEALPNLVGSTPLSADFGAWEFHHVLAVVLHFFLSIRAARGMAAGIAMLAFLAMLVLARRVYRTQRDFSSVHSFSGAAHLIGGFTMICLIFGGGNISYRGVLLLLLVPALLERLKSGDAGVRRLSRLELGTIACLLWLPAVFRVGFGGTLKLVLFWCLKEPLWFVMLSLTLGSILQQIRQFPIVAWLVSTPLIARYKPRGQERDSSAAV